MSRERGRYLNLRIFLLYLVGGGRNVQGPGQFISPFCITSLASPESGTSVSGVRQPSTWYSAGAVVLSSRMVGNVAEEKKGHKWNSLPTWFPVVTCRPCCHCCHTQGQKVLAPSFSLGISLFLCRGQGSSHFQAVYPSGFLGGIWQSLIYIRVLSCPWPKHCSWETPITLQSMHLPWPLVVDIVKNFHRSSQVSERC